MTVTPERTHWRDTTLNDLHRCWGWDVPALDLDFIEYNHGEPIALIEYKHEYAPKIDLLNLTSNLKVLARLASRASLPAFLCRYSDDKSIWRVAPLNDFARNYLATPMQFNLHDFVSFLYTVRGNELSDTAWHEITQEMGRVWAGTK